MNLSVVILNYNVCYFLEQCIKSVERATKNIEAEIIVIDNNSQDGSCAMVKEKFPNILLIENKENVGFSKANNQAVGVAKGNYICILNPDTAVSENTFLDCLHFAEDTKKLGAIGVYLLDGTGNFLPESKRNLPTPKVSLLKLLGFGRNYYARKVEENGKGKVDVLVGAFMFMKKAVYDEVQGFDEEYFMYGEDIDLSYKITQAGYDNYYLGTTSVLHYKGESTQKDAIYYERFYGAMSIFYRKHFSSSSLLNSLVQAGVSIAKKVKGKKSSLISETSMVLENTVVLTENFSLLKKLSEGLGRPLKASSKSIFQDSIIRDTLFIFDVTYMPYAQIFQVMKQLKNRNNQFRIYPPRSNFILGSDQSDEKGSVTVF